ncbi:hypothetical protein CAP35_00215 [Chitinophagaceae bacterium IBVUCB1]|nr:hypothetical protein CAP35_00215 [Chitinophagaceae bacterium IBVUCB1]
MERDRKIFINLSKHYNAMKQFLLILSAVATLTVYTSCTNKEFVCECINTNTADTIRTPVLKASQKQAERQCENGNGQVSSTFDCELIGSDTTSAK